MPSSRGKRWLAGLALAIVFLAAASVWAWSTFAGSPDPSGVRILTADVDRFWAAVDAAPEDSLAARLERDYIEGGTAAVRDFVPNRIVSAEALADMVTSRRAAYDSIRKASLALAATEPAIRKALWQLERLYPPARYPDVYFVVGRFNTGGTSSRRGLLVGAEMVAQRPEVVPSLAVHEAVHFNQPRPRRRHHPTILEQALREGVPSYVAYLATGEDPDSARHAFGEAHEAELWAAFRRDLDKPLETSRWFYGGEPEDWPADLGYFFGFRIAEAYMAASDDSVAAIATLIETRDAAAILEASGYDPGP